MQNFFDHIYVLNLDKRPDRWSNIRKQLDKAGISKAERFPAIHRNPGWIGCYESHLAILQKAFNQHVRNVLILEDDAELYPDWLSIWQSGKDQIKPDWDMLYLGYNLDPSGCQPPTLISPHLLYLNDVLTTHAYAVNGKCLEHLIDHISKSFDSNIPIDVIYARHFTQVKAYGIYPMLFHQAAGKSDILGCETNFPFRQNVDQVLASGR